MSAAPLTPHTITEAMILEAFPALTMRESSVLRWIVQGKSDGVIAVELCICTLTVSTHVKHLLAKLGVENRMCAAMEVICVIICGQPPFASGRK